MCGPTNYKRVASPKTGMALFSWRLLQPCTFYGVTRAVLVQECINHGDGRHSGGLSPHNAVPYHVTAKPGSQPSVPVKDFPPEGQITPSELKVSTSDTLADETVESAQPLKDYMNENAKGESQDKASNRVSKPHDCKFSAEGSSKNTEETDQDPSALNLANISSEKPVSIENGGRTVVVLKSEPITEGSRGVSKVTLAHQTRHNITPPNKPRHKLTSAVRSGKPDKALANDIVKCVALAKDIEKSEAVFQLFTDSNKEDRKGNSQFKLTDHTINIEKAVILAGDARRCIDLAKDIENGMASVRTITGFDVNGNGDHQKLAQSSVTFGNGMNSPKDVVKCMELAKGLENSVALVKLVTDKEEKAYSEKGVQPKLQNCKDTRFDMTILLSPPSSLLDKRETNLSDSWWRRMQRLPMSAANLAKNGLHDVYQKYRKRATPPVVPDREPSGPRLPGDQKITVSTIKDQATQDPSSAFHLTEVSTESRTAPLTTNRTSPLTTNRTSPPRGVPKSVKVRDENIHVHLIQSDLSDADKRKAIEMAWNTVVEAGNTVVEAGSQRVSTVLQSKFAATFGGEWHAVCGGAELHTNLKKVYSDVTSDILNTHDVGNLAKSPLLMKKSVWHLLENEKIKDVDGVRAVEIGEHACFNIDDTTILLFRDTGKKLGAPKILTESAVIVKESTMSAEMQWFAVRCARLAIDLHQEDENFSVAEFLNKKLNEAYSPRWHCVVGPEIHEALVFNNKDNLLLFKFPKMEILLWQS